MSLRVDEGRRRARSKSPGRPVERPAEDREDRYERERERERPAYESREPSYAYAEDDLDDYPRRRKDRDRDDDYRSGGAGPRESAGSLPYPEASSTALVMPGAFDQPSYRTVSPPADSPYRSSREKVDAGRDSRVRYSEYRDDEGPRRPERPAAVPFDADERFKHLPQKYSKELEKADRRRDDGRDDDPRRRRDDDDDYRRRRDDDDEYRRRRDDEDEYRRRRDDDAEYRRRRDDDDDVRRRHRDDDEDDYRRRRDDTGGRPAARRPASPPVSYRQAKKDQRDEDLAYGAIPEAASPPPPSRIKKMLGLAKPEEDLIDKFGYNSKPDPEYAPPDRKSHRPAYEEDPRRTSANTLAVAPAGSRIRDSSRDRRSSDPRLDKPGQPPTGKMSMLSVSTGHHSLNMSLSNAPGSPLLESYHGTYQQASPMPSPLLLAQPNSMSNVIDVSPLNSDDEGGGRINRRARFHDPEEVAARIAKALKGDRRAPDTEPLIQILPGLSHEEVMVLRTEYKAIVKAGADRKGVNVAKHIRSRLRDEDPNLMKACYAVALGQWESEAYWANFWYQGDKTRRELLIESLMGRSNAEIREIKDGFHDKKYGDSLVKCMKTELREDKFKKAVLLALSEERMEELDSYGRPLEVDLRLVDRDVDDLMRSVKSEKGGESLMISIVVLRSDSHLREIMKEYTRLTKGNFARDLLKKSTNLVGEVLAHILNGVINRPARDALLLHHALTASRKDDLRRELLTSRLVRFHWDRRHMEAVKRAYAQRYGNDLGDAVKEATSGEWGVFCQQLCITRMPNDVKRVARIEVVQKEERQGRERKSNTLEVGGRERGKSRSRSRARE
ncbi:related to annexin XIV [Cephalotrichum gorgonifer]|uniref:Related to annexin XIV n=1 Tax=Cephalotrichum gorgonifer TaxID=2041049 RepID=A0AAE8ST58_9PEZI|nr:related to annexin XIV [Cephalotrichum gorgonifer]